MAFDFLLGDKTSVFKHDSYSVGAGQTQVYFYCPRKGQEILAVLSGPFSVDATSNWEGVLKMGASQVLETIDNFAQGLFGNTIRQPWLSRKLWTGTTPLTFTLPLQFVSFDDAEAQVVKPMMGLLSLVYPRLDYDAGDVDAADMFSTYFVPGPTLFYVNDGAYDSASDEGDRVEITLGKFLHFKGCYIKSVGFNVENSFSVDGWPHNVKASVTFETMDVSYVNPDGSFMSKGFRDASIESNKQFEKLVNLVRGHTRRIIEAGKGLVEVISSLF